MIGAALRALTSMKGVQTVHFIDRDGFVIYSHGGEANEDSTGNMTRWQTLIQTAEEKAMITLVAEKGYIILNPVERRFLVVKCTRLANLGAVRSTIQDIDWPA